jgi:RNase H-fold protein (predicted Holliday junction resolvase)
MTKLMEQIMEAAKKLALTAKWGEESQRVFLAPEKVKKPTGYSSIFLAGSIEMGKARDWQTELTDKIISDKKLSKIIVANPRRKDWDSSWTQEKSNPQFFEQVTWELSNIESADFVVVYFDEKTQSPITLMELGIMTQSKPDRVVVICPDKFFRKGNVDITCDRYGVKQVNTLDEVLDFLKEKING